MTTFPPVTLERLLATDPGYRTGNEQRFLCPSTACSGKTSTRGHRSLAVNQRTGAYYCHRCGLKGKLAGHGYATTSYPSHPLPAPVVPSEPPSTPWRRWLAGMRPLLAPGTLSNTPAADYLSRRGITPACAMGCRAHYHPNWLHGGAAVLFPLYDAQGALVAAQGRYLHPVDDTPKVKSVGTVKQGAFLTPHALDGRRMLITEAPIDAMTLALAGYPALATCGAKNLPAWLPGACRGHRVLIAFDPDDGGEDGADALCAALIAAGVYSERLSPPVDDWNAYLCRHGLAALQQALAAVFHASPA